MATCLLLPVRYQTEFSLGEGGNLKASTALIFSYEALFGPIFIALKLRCLAEFKIVDGREERLHELHRARLQASRRLKVSNAE